MIEFGGDGIATLSVDDRLAMANMTTEWGALAGVFPADEVTFRWLRQRADDVLMYKKKYGAFRNHETVPSLQNGTYMYNIAFLLVIRIMKIALCVVDVHSRLNHARIDELAALRLDADPGASYARRLSLDLSTLTSQFVSGPNSVKKATPLSTLMEQNIKINKAYLVSCTNSRVSDIAAAANVFRQVPGCRVKDGVEFYVAAASSVAQEEAQARGDWQVLLNAGAKPLPPGCGPCIGKYKYND